MPKRGIGASSLEKLILAAEEMGWSLYEAALNAQVTNLSGRAANSLEVFAAMINDFRKMAEFLTVTELTEQILEKSDYLPTLKKERTLESEARIENINEFLSVTQQLDEDPQEDKSLISFLTDLALLSDLDTETEEPTSEITLMTLHAAKGLEFPVVFLIGMEEGLFPLSRAELNEEEMEEERRLAYVGITRAEEKLYLSNAMNRTLYGKTQLNRPSRFLDEIEDDLLERVESNSIKPFSSGINNAFGTDLMTIFLLTRRSEQSLLIQQVIVGQKV